MGEVSPEAVDEADFVMAEYEDRFQQLDSKLEAMRASFHDEANKNNTKVDSNHEGTTVVVEDEDDDTSTLDEPLSEHLGKLQASLAEHDAMEMERIVQAIQRQQNDNHEDDTASRTINKSTAPVAATANDTVPSSTAIPRWMLLLILIPTLLSAGLAYQLWFSTKPSFISDDSVEAVASADPETPPAARVQQQVYTRQVCRTVNGHRYCESEQESASVVNSHQGQGGGGRGGQQQQVYYQRQQCQYVNGESYCESYEEETSAQQSTQPNSAIY